jgi:methylmalonyl-CoA mutase N-terminal domain/subunit
VKRVQSITQLAFTLRMVTYVEYYLSRGMNINDFGPYHSSFQMVLILNMQLLVV